MPLVDMPLEKLRQYQGLNPKPADFDKYWDESIAEMKAVNPQIEIVPADFPQTFAKCSDMYFTGVDGGRLHAKLLQPLNPAPGKHPAIVSFHGYSGHGGQWCDFASYVAAGYTVASLDCRGQGGQSSDATAAEGTNFRGHIVRGLGDKDPKKLFFRRLFLDTAQMAGIVMDMPDVDETRVGAIGGSQGGGLTLACAALEPRIKLAAPTFPFLCDYRRVWEMDLAKDAYEELKYFFRMFDPQHKNEDEIFTRLGYIDNQHLASRIRAEVLMAVGLMDTICPPSTQFAAFNKITSKKNLEIYPDFGHEGLPGWGDRVFQFMMNL